MQEKGFTLIELVIVFSIIALLSIAGIASFAAFSQRQILINAVANLRTILNVARTRTLSQVNGVSPNACTSSEQFGGYVVVVCCNAAGSQTNCPVIPCVGSDEYDLFETCYSGSNPSYKPIQGGTFSSGITVSSATTARTFQFTPLTGTVTYGTGTSLSSGSVILNYSSQGVSSSVTVSSIGAIQ